MGHFTVHKGMGASLWQLPWPFGNECQESSCKESSCQHPSQIKNFCHLLVHSITLWDGGGIKVMKMKKKSDYQRARKWVFFWYCSRDRRLAFQKAYVVTVSVAPSHRATCLQSGGIKAMPPTMTSRMYGVGFKRSGAFSNFVVRVRMVTVFRTQPVFTGICGST